MLPWCRASRPRAPARAAGPLSAPKLRVAPAFVLLAATWTGGAEGQGMDAVLDRLFVFGAGESQLFLSGSGTVEETRAHGDHFLPDQSETNGALLQFFSQSIAVNVSSFPLPSTVAAQTFEIVGGVPTPTSTSFGPIAAERAQTIGRGRLNVGVNFSRLAFRELRGVSTDEIQLRFVHVNADFPGCDEAAGGDCTEFGVPQVENDFIDLAIDLDVDASVFALYTTYGITDRLDLSLAVPVVSLQVAGSSRATIVPSTFDRALHFFGGTPEVPQLSATAQTFGKASGIGDIAVRSKLGLVRGDRWDAALLAGVRLPTGREEDFLGAGDVNAKGLIILSGRLGDFSPHLNTGYEHRGNELDPDELELALGFDHRMADWATLAVEVLGAFKMDPSPLEFPGPVSWTAPFARTLPRSNIPSMRDDVVNGAVGVKLRTGDGVIVVANVILPLSDGGLRPGPVPTIGIEYPF